MTVAKQLYPETPELDISIGWEMELIHENHHYLAVWAKNTSTKTGYSDCFLDVFEINGKKIELLSEDDNKNVTYVKAAAQAFQQAKIQSEFSYSLAEIENKHLNIFDNFESVIENIFNRAQSGEFLGQHNNRLYIQDVASILGFSFPVIHTSVVKLEAQHRLGLNGNVLIPWEARKENIDYGFAATGHRDYDVSEMGETWWCRACGNSGDFNTNKPNDVPCT